MTFCPAITETDFVKKRKEKKKLLISQWFNKKKFLFSYMEEFVGYSRFDLSVQLNFLDFWISLVNCLTSADSACY